MPDFTLFDAAVRYDLGVLSLALEGAELKLNVSNLFDNEYVSSCVAAPNFCAYGLRRTVFLTLGYRW